MKKHIIVPTGYMGSGSSAVTDYLSEFTTVNVPNGSFEYIFLHCPDGLFDLEDKLLIGNTAIRSDEAIYRFKEQMKFLYGNVNFWAGNYKEYISKDFLNYVDEFLTNLAGFELKDTCWYFQQMQVDLKMRLRYLICRAVRIVTLRQVTLKEPLRYPSMNVAFPTEKEFYNAAEKFLGSVINDIAGSHDNVVLDQLLLPHNLYRMPNYFDDNCKVIIVERDPRDVFLLNKYVWKPKDVAVPYPTDVKAFCKYYKRMRRCEKPVASNNVLRIHFEDLVYKYEETSKQINQFLGLTHKEHINRYKRFDPEVSKRNTFLFKKLVKKETEIQVIEHELKDYLYAYDDIPLGKTNGQDVSGLF